MKREETLSPLPVRIEHAMLAARRPLSADEVAEVVSTDAAGPAPSVRVVERELRSDAARYVNRGHRYVHQDRRDLLRTSPAATITGAPQRGATQGRDAPLARAWLKREPRLWHWQTEALAAWESNGRRGIVAAVTGAGKTNVGIAAIVEHIGSGGAAVVIVPTQELMHQWEARIRTWAPVAVRHIGKLDGSHRDNIAGNDVLIAVVNSASAHLAGTLHGSVRPVLLIADECHRYGANSFRRALDGAFVGTLGLSATPERTGDSGMADAVIPRLGHVVYEYRYERALSDGVISEFDVTFVGLDLAEPARHRYERLTDAISTALRELMSVYPQLEENPYLFAELERLIEETHDRRIGELFRAVTERQQILQDAPARQAFVEWLAEQGLPGSRGILFHSRIEGCEALAASLRKAGIAVGVHHSALSKTDRKAALRDFERGRVRVLCSPKTLDEGIDVPDADFAVLVSGSTVTRQRIQRLGRVLRKVETKDCARGYVLYMRDTVEDPASREDAFSRELETLNRASWSVWPSQSTALSATFSA